MDGTGDDRTQTDSCFNPLFIGADAATGDDRRA